MVRTEKDVLGTGGIPRTLAVATVMVAAVLVAATGTAGAATTINSCATINASNAPADGLVLLGSDINNAPQDSCVNITVSNIVFDGQNNVVDGDGSSGTDGILVTNTSTTISNVTVRNVNSSDWGGAVTYSTVDGGLITGVNATPISTPSTAISVSGLSSRVHIRNNDVNDGIAGISPASDSIVANNTVSSSIFDGIRATATTTNLTVRDNEFNGVGGTGIVVDNNGGDSRVVSNNVTSAGTNGIEIAGGQTNATVMGNNISGAAENGTVVESSTNVTLRNNDITNSGSNGIILSSSSDNNVASNNASANTESGISVVSGSDRTVIDDNTVLDNNQGGSFGGVFVNNSDDTEITNNEVHRNTLFGVGTIDANGTVVRGNSITDNCGGTAGLVVAGTSNDLLIESNNASANTGTGVDIGLTAPVNGSNLTIRDVVANDNGQAGVVVQGPQSPKLRDIEANDNTNLGVGVNSQDSTLDNITAVGNNDTGIFVASSGNETVIENSDVRENGFGTTSTTGILVQAPDVAIRNTTTTDNDLDLSAQSSNTTLENVDLGSATVSGTAKEVDINETVSPPADPSNAQNISKYFNATDRTADSFFDATVHYTDTDAMGVDESRLALWRYDGSWNELTGSTVDTAANTVSANITSFSVFAPLSSEAEEGCVDRRDLSRGQEDQECPRDRTIERGGSRDELDRRTGRNSDTSRRDRGRRSRGR